MDFLELISQLLAQCLDAAIQTDRDYAQLHRREGHLLKQLAALTSEELVDKLTEAQLERMDVDRTFSFLCGLRLGTALLDL
ncbi:hypothetical protein [Vermiculatibacterium agrestimuris]|uniref:hypothetical protein n=1 Tax=Vermiculatibacterium agrestimuris TaxID=2941519 RepID=UPI00203E9FE6|nr:hypothetical protein [Vermiculatibacterium agrestimuris]